LPRLPAFAAAILSAHAFLESRVKFSGKPNETAPQDSPIRANRARQR
jgi:hypothetical protein